MDLAQLTQRVLELEDRVGRVEGELGVRRRRVMPPAVVAPAVIVEKEPVVEEQEEEIEPVVAREEGVSLETRIGKYLAGWVGAMVLVVGVGFFLKYAYAQGWIHPSPAGRVIAAVLMGVGLEGVGEYLYRRGMRGMAGVLYAAGVAVAMTAFFAAGAYFTPPVLSQTPAGVMVCLTAAVGIGLALRADLPVVAVLSLLGAYLSPAILNSGVDRSGVLLGYLVVLGGTGWVLSLARPRWTGLRVFTLIASWVWYGVWFAQLGHRHESLAFAYLAVMFAGTLGEVFLTLQREFKEAPMTAAGLGSGVGRIEGSGAVVSLVNTLLTAGGLYLLYWRNQPLAGSLMLGLAAVQGVVALGTFSRQLRYSAVLQGTALVTLAVPLLFSQLSINGVWLVMGVALAILNRRLDLRWMRAWSVVLWILAAGKLFVLDGFNPAMLGKVALIGSQPVTRWLLMAWGVAVTGHALAFLGRRQQASPDWAGSVLAVFGTIAFLAATARGWGAGPVFTMAGIVWLVAIAGLRKQGGRIGYVEHAWVLAIGLACKWLFADGLAVAVEAYTNPAADGLMPVLNLPALCAVLLAGIFVWFGRPEEGEEPRPGVREIAYAGVAGVVFFLLNFELLRGVNHWAGSGMSVHDLRIAKQVALSIFWALAGLGAVTGGFAKKAAQVRYAGLALLGVTLLKVLTVDMAGVETIWRILSFMAVGGLLMCVSFVYYRQMETRAANEVE